MNWRQSFSALKYRNYRLWFWGQLVSLFGTWMQTTAQGYFVFELTHSPAYLGYLSFVSGIPTWLFMLYAGVISDRMSRRNLLIITQTVMMSLAFILAALTFSDLVRPWHIMVLVFGSSVANAFDAPARQSFVLDMVDREDLTNAIALNSTMFNAAMAVGPAIAGIVYALFGPAWCFTINGLSFLAVIVALWLMHIKPKVLPPQQNSPLSEFKEGFRYVAAQPTVRTLVLLAAIFSLLGFSFVTLFPAWAKTVLNGNETTNGLLQSARGIGAMIGALGIASLGRFTFKGKLLTAGSFVFPIGLFLFSLTRWLPLSLLTLVITGIALILVWNLANALVQTIIPDQLRGRVMGIYSFAMYGFMPLGGLFAGAMAEWINEPFTVALSALILFGGAILVWIFAPELRKLE